MKTPGIPLLLSVLLPVLSLALAPGLAYADPMETGLSGAKAAPMQDETLPGLGSESTGKGSQEGAALEGEAGVQAKPSTAIEDIGPRGLLELARSLAAQGETSEAVNTYRLLIQRFPLSKKRNTAYYELGVILYRKGRVVEARTALERVVSSWWVDGGLREKARTLLMEIESMLRRGTEEPEGPAIGLIMPLKGRYRPYGEAALKGVLLAAGVFGPVRGLTIEVMVRDVGGGPAEGAGAVTELGHNSRLDGIVGPLRSATAYGSAARAEAVGMPIITLSQRPDITGAGRHVFRLSMTPSEEAALVARYAVSVLGKKTFAVLYPEGRTARTMAETFTETVTGLGATVAETRSYAEGTKDFGPIIEEIFKVETDEVQEGRRTLKEYFPSTEIEALYIPDSYRTVSLVTPYIKYYNIEELQLLGSSAWDSPRLLQLAGPRAMEGAVFVDGFFAGSSRRPSADFARTFTETYGRPPGELEAMAYDAAGLLIKAVDSDNPSREVVTERLRSMRDYDGAEGSISFDPYGGAVKKPFVLTVREGKIVEAPWPEEMQVPGPGAGQAYGDEDGRGAGSLGIDIRRQRRRYDQETDTY